MTISVVNQSITLGAHSPKKDHVVATGVPTVANDAVAIWVGSAINPALVQSIVGDITDLMRHAKGSMPALAASLADPVVLHKALGANDVVLDGTPTTSEIQLIIGTDITSKEQSHFLDRTVKRLIEAWLEA